MANIQFITILASDMHSSEYAGKTFTITEDFKSEVEAWEKTLPFSRYELTTSDFIDDYPKSIQAVLEELEIN